MKHKKEKPWHLAQEKRTKIKESAVKKEFPKENTHLKKKSRNLKRNTCKSLKLALNLSKSSKIKGKRPKKSPKQGFSANIRGNLPIFRGPE